ncbi:quinoprotein dehydrogenase-associated putative ABC transporter substrate-binding protein [Candidatus Methylomicrobium oryzae]|jgi:quinoprotein dehydrogenase-associated probable ABC transporter substrate-binding protein|uniref:quinoprotein dehydrogenase-associated putative ABC transporter substrate-binding protein n=1 Tax=Candidatus Methylomicrobium oryzae TaxID=2802053 RepID=UPI0019222260|nr:quinoprotein dehydrogenase-associated putative ABC transporter substrate-binding protein [Methylomicrobium sp. RS1]MBL1262889.1 quinoprotein dehydrogenase-associated putative ABC transporter substrate-binding protein [Methylomicrobium sp. RS1]
MQAKSIFRRLLISAFLLGSVAPVHAKEKFKVCADPLNPPYSTKNKDGFENKIAELFAKKLGQKVEYTWFPQRIGFIRNTLNAPVNEKEVDSKEFKCDVVMNVPAGSDMALTTEPYYQSTYVLLIAKGRGFDNIKSAQQLAELPVERQDAAKIAMFDRGPGTAWLQKHGMLEMSIPYQSMSGDEDNNVAMEIDRDLKAKKINMVIVWGPIAGYIVSHGPKNGYTVIPMHSEPGIPFEFAMAMGVRNGDKERQQLLNKLIAENKKEIQRIIESYHIPLTEIKKTAKPKDDD